MVTSRDTRVLLVMPMSNSSFLALVQNAALLLALAVIFDTTSRRWRVGEKIWKQVFLGLLFGGIGIAVMNTPWIYGKGLFFDTRSILLCISGLFFGTIPTIIAMVMTSVYRLIQGGAYFTGISVIVVTSLTGILWRHLSKWPLHNLNWWNLYFFGVIVHLEMLLLMFTQPFEIALPLVSKISLPVMLIYPFGTMLLGLLLTNRIRREKDIDEIKKSQRRLISMVEILQNSETDSQVFIDFAMEEAVKLTESMLGFIFYYSEETKRFALSSWSKSAVELCKIPVPQTIYELDKTGIWGEPVRQRKPIIINNFKAENPLKKGFPDGHPLLSKLLEVPIISENRIVAVVGMANKSEDYNEIDVMQLRLLMEMVWKTIERKNAVEELRLSEENYHLLFDHSVDGIFIIGLEGECLDVNESGCSMLGYSLEELRHDYKGILQNVDESFNLEPTFFELQKKKNLLTQRILKTKNGESIDVEILTQILPDGRIQKVVRNITERKIAEEFVEQAHKELQASLKVSDDSRKALLSVIEDQKDIEEALRKSEKSYRNLFENITQGFALHKIILNENGIPIDYQFLAANPAFERLTGLQASNILGRYVKEIIPDVEQSWIDTYGKVALTGQPTQFEDYSASIGKYYDVAAFSPEHGYFAVVISDISERKKYELEIQNFNAELENRVKQRTIELELANKELESFSYSISHDLRAPLRSINGFSQIIMDEYAQKFEPDLLHYFDLIRKNATMMGSLVDDLLNFSRLGRQSIKKVKVNPNRIIEEIIDSVQVELHDRKIDFIVQKLPECKADPSLLRQVFFNLIANSIKFTLKKKNAKIEIGYLDVYENRSNLPFPSGIACYFIKDNGVGFDMQFYDKLFGVFQRLHRAEDYEGTGVGLAIVDRIIKKHGGTIWAESVLEQGTTFYFTFGESKNGK